MKPRGRAERVLAADRDQAVEARRVERRADQLGPVIALERIRPGGAQDGAAARQDAARRLDGEVLVNALDRPAPAVAEADDLVSVVVDPPAHDGPDDRVQARAIASPREHADPHDGHDTQARHNAPPWDWQGHPSGGRWRSRALLSGCGDSHEPARIQGNTATVYSSAPRHGVSVAAARAVVAGERRALEDAGGRAGKLRIRLRELPTTSDEPDHPWDPGLVSTNAHRAADDPTAIAYLGELDYGASAVSLPITNEAGLLQVSPGDGLTSLTRRPPGRLRAGPERYYPSDQRSFVRIGPSDLDEAEWLVDRVSSGGGQRLATVFDREIYGRELAGQIAALARRDGIEPVASEEFRGGLDQIPEIARNLAEARPDAVIYLGVAGPATARLLSGIDSALPSGPLLASSGILAAGEALVVPPGPARIEAVGPALSPERAGYDAMRLVLDAVEEGQRNRQRVIAAALRLREPDATDRLALYRPGADGRFERVGAAR